MGKQKHTEQYRWIITGVGVLVCLFSAFRLPLERIDMRFLLLTAMTVIVSSRVAVQIPRFDTNVTVSDTFIFLAILLYGGEAGILLAVAEGLCSGARISKSKKPVTILFSGAVMACSTFVTVWVTRFAIGPNEDLYRHTSSLLLTALSTMALTQYISNTGLVAVALALKTDQPFWHTWSKHYLWTSITYIVGAAAAGATVVFVNTVGFYALMVTLPIISIIYFTYHKFLEDIKRTAAQAEQAERERAEQAELHIVELSRHIAEQERISRALQESKEHFRHAAFHDALTGLPNRALLTDHLKLAIERAKRREDHLFAVLFLDLDRFKNINDSLGHTIGDQLLVAIARRVEDCLRPMDTVARLGGDEFAILLDGLEDFNDAVRVAERVQHNLMQPFNLQGHEVYTTTSIGIALSTTGYEQPENILRDADIAMYRAKDNGKARYELFDTVMHTRAVALLKMENDLRRAIERQEFRVYYQPIVSLETDQITGFEALVRWEHPQQGLVPPSDFIPLSEETGLIMEIGQWVLRESCRQMRQWQLEFQRPLTLSVNLSGKQFVQPNLIEQIKTILRETEFDPRWLRLEITESVVMENAEAAASMLLQLRDLGVHLSIDDFGTGYSSLSYLHRFPVTTLKIDRSFIGRMGENDENAEIVRTIMTLANNLGMEVVAEGIETADQLAQLRALKCEYGQGYLFSRPVDAASAQAIFVKRLPRAIIPLREEAPILEAIPFAPYIN
jgi:diguanylate cyclase (GGDEF)-like protein